MNDVSFLFPDVFVQFFVSGCFLFSVFCLLRDFWSVFVKDCCFFPGVFAFFLDFFQFLARDVLKIYTLQTNSSHLNMDGWVSYILVSFLEGLCSGAILVLGTLYPPGN